MNGWQKTFTILGCISFFLLTFFPPQFLETGQVRFYPFYFGYPVDWLRLFTWFVVALVVTGLGVAINKDEHK